jgi:hypothetical protein
MTANSAPAPQPALTFRRFREGDDTYPSWQDAIFSADHSDKCPIYVHRPLPARAPVPPVTMSAAGYGSSKASRSLPTA